MREGDAFAGCTVISVCGTGAYGTVYLVEDALGRKVALKVFHSLSPDDKVLEALRRYAELPSSIDILVRILHFGVEDGRLFYLMEAADNASEDEAHYLPDTLALRLERKGRLDLEEALAIYRQLLKGMAVLHKLGLVHRDIKPANIFYVNGKIKLGDPDLLNDYTKTLSVAGSLGFIPPEFLTAKQPKTPVGDIYALGKTFYCSVTGEMPESYPHYPTDLSADTLYRIVLPLSRICNRNPEMRASTCSECLELLSQERNADTSHWRQFLTKMALSRRYRNIAVGVAVLLLIMVALLGYGAADFIARIRRLNEEALAKSNARRENMAALVPKLKLQLPEAQHADFEQQFTRAEQLLKKGRRNAFNRALDGIEERLREIAAKEVPPQGRDFDSIANMLGYLASPLGSQCLDLEKRSELKDTALHDAQALSIGDSPCLGKDFTNPTYLTNMQFKLVFMPPGKFISPVGSRYTEDKSKLIAIDYPYWIFDREISNEICNQLLGVDCVAGEGESMPCTQIGWYEIIHLCQELTDHWRSPYVLPKGYAVRPPTEAEWEYAAVGGWGGVPPEERTVPKVIHPVFEGGEPNALGIYDIDANCAELTIRGTSASSLGVVARVNPVLSKGRTGIKGRAELQRDVLKLPGVGFRLVLAPTPEDFFEKQLNAPPVEARHAIVNGRHYASIFSYYAACKLHEASELASSLGAQLFEPASMEEFSQVSKAIKISSFPFFIGARYENGQWLRLSDNRKLELPGLPVPEDASYTALNASSKRFASYKPGYALPRLLFEWTSEDAWHHRADGWKNGTGPGVKAHFTIRGRTFAVVKGTMAGYVASAYCSIAGARPAVLSDKALRDEVVEHLGKLGLECPVTLGALKTGRDWHWLDNTPLFAEKEGLVLEPVKGRFHITYKHVIPVLVAFNGKLFSSRETEMILVEFL